MTESEVDTARQPGLSDREIARRSIRSAYLKPEPLAPEILAELREHAERTGVGAMRLLRGASDKPSGLTATVIGRWLNGKAESAVPSHVEYALERWAALPTNRRIPLTAGMRAELIAEFARTGKGPVPILKQARDIPDGLTRQIIQVWASDKPKPGTVGETHWDYVMSRLRALPDGAPSASRLNKAGRMRQVEISASDLAELLHHRERTGIGGALLLRSAKDVPAGLTPAMISGWMSGQAKKADPAMVAFTLARYRAWP